MKRSSKIRSLAIGCAVVAAMGVSGLVGHADRWPTIQPLHREHAFLHADRANTDLPFLAFIKDTDGAPVYKFECHSGDYNGESEMNFSGYFQCALFAIKGDALTSTDLLAADTNNELSSDWWNRGRMLSRQLRGKCLAYPEYSTDRHFRLRGMLITMRFTDVEWSARKDQQGNAMIARFTFTLDAVRDRGAQSSRTELPVGPKPPPSCFP